VNAVFLEEYVGFAIDLLPIGISDARNIRTFRSCGILPHLQLIGRLCPPTPPK
jgi:hypothetical protein